MRIARLRSNLSRIEAARLNASHTDGWNALRGAAWSLKRLRPWERWGRVGFCFVVAALPVAVMPVAMVPMVVMVVAPPRPGVKVDHGGRFNVDHGARGDHCGGCCRDVSRGVAAGG